MKKIVTRLMAIFVLILFGTYGNAFAYGGDDDRVKTRGHSGLPFIVKQNSADIRTNTGNIADNFSQIQDNRTDITDLDSRVSNLEAGGTPGNDRTVVDVDCVANSNALLESPINGSFPDNTTYNLTGACNGPLYVTEDGVRFVGIDSTAAIVLPGGIDPSNGAVFGDGAQDLRIQNLLLDASAWGSGAVAEDTDAAGVYARNAFIRLIDTRIVGGLWGINPFRNAIVRTQGVVEITGYVNSAISVGDQSMITARGPVFMSSNVTDGSYLGAVDIYRSGVMDFRAGVTVNHPPADPGIGFYPFAIEANGQSHLRIRNNGPIDIQGGVFLSMLATARIDGGNFNGDMSVLENSVLTIRNASHTGHIFIGGGGVANLQDEMNQIGGINVDTGGNLNLENAFQSDGDIHLGLNSSARFSDSTIGFVEAVTGAVFEIGQGEFDGAQISQGSVASLFDAATIGNIQIFGPASLNYFGDASTLNGYTIFLCGTTDSNIDADIAASGTVSEFCGP
jgi:hypothetical protein